MTLKKDFSQILREKIGVFPSAKESFPLVYGVELPHFLMETLLFSFEKPSLEGPSSPRKSYQEAHQASQKAREKHRQKQEEARRQSEQQTWKILPQAIKAIIIELNDIAQNTTLDLRLIHPFTKRELKHFRRQLLFFHHPDRHPFSSNETKLRQKELTQKVMELTWELDHFNQ